MRNRALKDMIWAACIAIALAAVFVGFVLEAVGHYYGDKSRPVMDLGHSVSAPKAEVRQSGMTADGTVHRLQQSGDAGQVYLDSLVYLCDASFIPLRSSGLTAGQVWGSESGSLPMNKLDLWTITFPADNSQRSPGQACMLSQPKTLVLCIGSEGLDGLNEESFVQYYEALIEDIHSYSPATVMICCPVASVAPGYTGLDSMNGTRAAEINSWIVRVCRETGAWYADLTSVLNDGGYLRPEFAEPDGRTLNAAGLNAMLNYLRIHALSAN